MDNKETINKIIRNRRSVKPEYFDETKEVPKAILEQILHNANWAPTHAHTEPWRFVVFAGNARKKLGEFEANYYKQKTAEDKFVQTKYDKALNRPEKATYILAIVMQRQLDGRKVVPELEEIAATACAVQNMWLTAAAYGVSAYWGSGGATFSDEMKSFLNLKVEDICLGFFYLGYSDRDIPDGRRMSEIGEKVEWHK